MPLSTSIRPKFWISRHFAFAFAMASVPTMAFAYDHLDFIVRGQDEQLRTVLQDTSLLGEIHEAGTSDPREIIAAALADYARLLDALYSQGYYGGVIHILIDGKEAARISPFSAPAAIGTVRVEIDPGPQFQFGTATVAPLPPGATPVSEYRSGAVARSTAVRDAATTAIEDWRNSGRAKAEIASQAFTADHRTSKLDARIGIAPGPLVRFGDLVQLTPSTVRAARIARIAGLPSGTVFSPDALIRVAERLRRTGAFSSVSVTEAKQLGSGDTMDVNLSVADQKPRRFGISGEVSSLEGVTVSGFWLHRNIFGGAERLRFDGEISDIAGTAAGIDASLSARLDIPAAFGTDKDAFLVVFGDYVDDPAFVLKQGGVEAGIHVRRSPSLEFEAGIAYRYSITDDDLGHRRFSLVSLPASLTWNRRDSAVDPVEGFYLHSQIEPFHDFLGGATGVRGWLDGRTYLGVNDNHLVFAGRGLAGIVAGADAADTPPDFLFFSGGSNTVRGFPYQSLGVDIGGGNVIGGRAFLGLSGEIRYRLNDTFGLVGFVDAGHVGAESFFDTGGGWQIGAGAGIRYYTGLGPLRLDIAMPVSGPGGTGLQIYLGIGQAF